RMPYPKGTLSCRCTKVGSVNIVNPPNRSRTVALPMKRTECSAAPSPTGADPDSSVSVRSMPRAYPPPQRPCPAGRFRSRPLRPFASRRTPVETGPMNGSHGRPPGPRLRCKGIGGHSRLTLTYDVKVLASAHGNRFTTADTDLAPGVVLRLLRHRHRRLRHRRAPARDRRGPLGLRGRRGSAHHRLLPGL